MRRSSVFLCIPCWEGPIRAELPDLLPAPWHRSTRSDKVILGYRHIFHRAQVDTFYHTSAGGNRGWMVGFLIIMVLSYFLSGRAPDTVSLTLTCNSKAQVAQPFWLWTSSRNSKRSPSLGSEQQRPGKRTSVKIYLHLKPSERGPIRPGAANG